MTGSKIQSFDLFKAAMGNTEYLTEINKDGVSQAKFLTTLEEGKLTLPKLLESIQITRNPQVKSLLIIHLLSQNEYLSCLKGDSLLNRLSTQDYHLPSRLNALIHQLDLQILSPQMIEKLDPEAALSIICSVPHFHQLTRIQLQALIERFPLYERHKVLSYWMNHFVSMPNAHYLLAHFMNIAGPNVIQELSKMEPNQKEAVVINIIEHLGCFHKLPNKFLEHANKESHLILAIRLYLNGHYNQANAAFINQLTLKLLDKNHAFSLEAIELLFCLNDKLAFKELAKKTAYYTNCYLRNNAFEGKVALFYQSGQINIQRTLQNIHLKPHILEASSEQRPASIPEESSFIEALLKHDKSINCFEYFLFHYKGNFDPIFKLLNDYMMFYEQCENARSRNKAIHHLGFMLKRPELDITVKEALFTAFLNHPLLFDEQVSYQLFLFDAKRIIRYFGLQGGKENYQRVINLCTLALKNLNSEKNGELIQIAQQALSEARQELIFSNRQGFLSSVIKWIQRCWAYGWTGFFKPNLPTYVLSENWAAEETQQLPVSIQDSTSTAETQDLHSLLNNITLPLTQEKVEDIIKALDWYSLQPVPTNELITRFNLHQLFHYILQHKEDNRKLYHWLKDNQNPFIVNQFRLLELMLKERSRDEINLLLLQINEDSDNLQYISEELNSLMPELVIKPRTMPSNNSEKPDFVESTAKVLSGYVYGATEYAQSALHWAEGFFSKIKKPVHEEEDDFEVEHIDSFNSMIREN
ncbi:hypothetical protein [Fluoribacter dumoffii]|uniref:Dot/Icm T4SS effector n=1 Tax=Fluoribacter dumoffii TaxID=463 RepID=A0A377GDP4_9GAMM|nr:hypothetical protein [Fluoribacter dumoffii]KTC90841.1 Dot/Icm T4SS effector [Fluoribacter dumoffii NY 23]STO22690.1 Uncharacterised protein [Fluoribacter dumoffii]